MCQPNSALSKPELNSLQARKRPILRFEVLFRRKHHLFLGMRVPRCVPHVFLGRFRKPNDASFPVAETLHGIIRKQFDIQLHFISLFDPNTQNGQKENGRGARRDPHQGGQARRWGERPARPPLPRRPLTPLVCKIVPAYHNQLSSLLAQLGSSLSDRRPSTPRP